MENHQQSTKGENYNTPYIIGRDYPNHLREKMRLPDARPAAWQETIKKELLPPRQRQEGPPPPLQVHPEAGQKERRADGLKHERAAARSQKSRNHGGGPAAGAPRSRQRRPRRRRLCTTRPKSRSTQTSATMQRSSYRRTW